MVRDAHGFRDFLWGRALLHRGFRQRADAQVRAACSIESQRDQQLHLPSAFPKNSVNLCSYSSGNMNSE